MAVGSVKLIGDKNLEKKLRTLSEKLQRKVLRRAISAGATPIVKAVKSKVKVETGTLALSIGKKIKAYPKTGAVIGVVGPRFSVTSIYKGRRRRPAYYAHLAERGHIASNGTFVPGNHAVKKAYEETKDKALNIIKAKMAAGIAKEK